MSVIKSIQIKDQSKDKEMICFPDRQLLCWDVSVRERTGVYWYYQMHITSIMDLIYRAGRDGLLVSIRYQDDEIGKEMKEIEL